MIAPASRWPEPGIHLGVPFADYHALKAVSNSGTLKKMRRSALYFDRTRGADSPDTADRRIGRAVHTLALEPNQFYARFAVLGKCAGLTKTSGPCRYNASVIVGGVGYCGTHAPEGVEPDALDPLSDDQAERARAMADAVWADEDAAALLRRCPLTEVSVVWIDETTGLLCKGRIDRLGESNPISATEFVDLKKSRAAHPDTFAREMLKMGYHTQLAWYGAGLRANGVGDMTPTIVAVNDAAGDDVHEVGVYPLIVDALMLGHESNQRVLAEYAECVRTGRWPGFGTRPLSVPGWALMANPDDVDEEVEA